MTTVGLRYSVTHNERRDQAEGPREAGETTYFRLVEQVSNKERPHLMPTVVSAEDLVLAAGLA